MFSGYQPSQLVKIIDSSGTISVSIIRIMMMEQMVSETSVTFNQLIELDGPKTLSSARVTAPDLAYFVQLRPYLRNGFVVFVLL
jgi:hypothetical protein